MVNGIDLVVQGYLIKSSILVSLKTMIHIFLSIFNKNTYVHFLKVNNSIEYGKTSTVVMNSV